jgi:hypothetical protein
MKMPGFNAGSSVGPANGLYRGRSGFSFSGRAAAALSPAQSFLGSSAFEVIGFPFPIQRCCAYVPRFHSVVCVTHQTRPLEFCECQRPPGEIPFFVCHGPVNAPF